MGHQMFFGVAFPVLKRKAINRCAYGASLFAGRLDNGQRAKEKGPLALDP
jgi:hypothetical protein